MAMLSCLLSSERESGMTPLMHAAKLGDAGMVEVLLRAGASTTLTNHQGHTATRVAQDAGFPAIAATITHWTSQGTDVTHNTNIDVATDEIF